MLDMLVTVLLTAAIFMMTVFMVIVPVLLLFLVISVLLYAGIGTAIEAPPQHK